MTDKLNIQVEEEVVENEVSLAEADAASTLKPSNTTKSALLSQMMGFFAGMKKEDLSAFMDKTLAQVGKEDDTVPDTSAKNAASINMNATSAPSPSAKAVKEDIAELFSGQEDLTEEFVGKATTLFEAAVSNRVAIEVARLEEEMEAKLEEEVSESIDELHNQVSTYMDYVVEKWMEQNEVAIENNFRVEATESFIEGLKGLFAENYVEVPEERVNLLGDLYAKIESLEESLELVEAENIHLSSVINEARVEAAFDEISEGLVETQVEKLRSLSEGMEYDSIDEYENKLQIIKEQYFTESKEKVSTGLITEQDSIGSNDEPENSVVIPEDMKTYFNAISKTVRK